MTNRYIIDIETDGLEPDVSQVWCIVCRNVDLPNSSPVVFTKDGEFGHRCLPEFKEWAADVDQFIGHNIVAYDLPVLNRLLDLDLSSSFPHAVDTFVVSRLTRYKHFSTHSLDELGTALGYPKTEFHDWSHLSEEMISYCIDDTTVNLAIWQDQKRFIDDEAWASSMWVEHEMHGICRDMRLNGFYFNATMAKRRLEEIEAHISRLEDKLSEFEPFRREVARIQYRLKKDMTPYQTVLNAYENYDECVMEKGELVCYNYVPFNPGSTKDRVEKLWEFGWSPVEKTDTSYKFSTKGKPGEPWGKSGKRLTRDEYEAKKEYFDYYGWTVNEVNLETLPSDAPEGARVLAQWLTLDGRRKALVERLQCTARDYRIHTNFWHIGSWTGRMAHTAPNLANISSPFHGEPRSPVDEIKSEYDADMRRMFTVESGYLVGTDAESIQLRVLAHYLKNDEYVHAILEGNKADETDIHNVNRRALGLNHLTRDHAKTFIYAWLLGAGVGKVARILDTTMAGAKTAMDSFIERTHGLASLKSGLIRRDAGRGYFVGLDGRKVLCNSEYLMLAGYLQNGESVIMKHANAKWLEDGRKEKINFKQVNFVHDEWQTQVYDSLDAAERMGELQRNALVWAGEKLNCYCPMAGETKIGHDWLDTH